MQTYSPSPTCFVGPLVELKSAEETTTPKLIHESHLISRFQAGDETALEEIIDIHKGPLNRYIFRFVNNRSEADDILSYTFSKAWINRSRYQPRARFQTWLYTIAGNLCRDQLRKQKRHPQNFAARLDAFEWDRLSDNAINSSQIDPSKKAVFNEEMVLLQQAVNELPHKLKSAFILFSLEGHSQEEVSRLLGCTPKTIETRVYRAKKRIRSKLAHLLGR